MAVIQFTISLMLMILMIINITEKHVYSMVEENGNIPLYVYMYCDLLYTFVEVYISFFICTLSKDEVQ